MELYSRQKIEYIRRKYKFNFSKGLGQNFLTDKSVIDDIVEASMLNEETLVIEIGPGVGTLTEYLAEVAGSVVAVELDKRLIPILSDMLAMYKNVEIINDDILKVDINKIIENKFNENKNLKYVRIVGNLPYYITTPIIMKLLETGIKADSITVMMQKEVADRLCAGAGSKEYGAITLSVQYFCNVNFITSVPANSFVPPPKVDSAVLRLDIRKEKPVSLLNESTFFSLIKAGFGKRRKTMSNSLSGACGLTKEELAEAFKQLDIDPKRRAETMDIFEFEKLANFVYLMKKENEK
ncbi:MAG: 16S rRNA (adenine(1518)-N(6)/adenine(1519)-N(6))-dimethyltransferase RsmA [Eubacteriales bacterium]